ncbi:hypothetical protein BBJ28_00026412, partial [Nothophytophthora sp. Chile5]
MDDGPERKRQRLATADEQQQADPPSPPPHREVPPDVPAMPVNWDFLSPWCEELYGRLLMVDGYVRALREKRSNYVIDFEENDEEGEVKESEQAVKARLAASHARTREALELLTLVAHVDKSVWHMLLTERCGLRLDGEENDEEEGESIVLGGEEEGVLLLNDEEDDEGEGGEEDVHEEREGERGSEGGESSDENEDDEGTVDILRNAFNRERQIEREIELLIPQFDFATTIARAFMERERAVQPPLEEWKALFFAETPHSQPSAAYEKAKAQILAMQATGARARPQIGCALEIPVSLELGLWPSKQEHVTDYLQELSGFLQVMQSQAQQLEDRPSMKADATFVYRLRRLSLLLDHSKITDLFATRLLAVFGPGIPVLSLGLSLNARSNHVDKKATREALAKLLSGILLRLPNPADEESRAIDSLQIDCDMAHPWRFKALCSALAVARTPIAKVCLSNVCEYRSKAAVRRADWRALAHALLRSNACKGGQFSSVRGLELPDATVTMKDLAEVASVLKEREHCRQRWLLREGTLLQLLDREAEEGNATVSESVTLAFDTHVEFMEEHPGEKLDDDDSEWLDVI